MEDRGGRIWAEKNAEEEATFCYGTDILFQVYLFAEFRSTCCDRKHYANAEKRVINPSNDEE